MRVTVSDREIWTPDWRDNLKQPEDQRVRVHLLYPTTKMQGHLQSVDPEIRNVAGKHEVSVKIQYDHDRILTDCVPKLENLEVANERNEVKPIRTGKELLEARGLSDLRDLIVARLMAIRTDEDELGNS